MMDILRELILDFVCAVIGHGPRYYRTYDQKWCDRCEIKLTDERVSRWRERRKSWREVPEYPEDPEYTTP